MKPGKKCFEQAGTPAYLAPEIIKKTGYSGFASDMWSAGVCLYAMLVGSVPFKASTMSALNNLILDAKYDFEF
jgi:serine/threonine protein kinase